ncbi:PNK3P-domain-containing protein [Gymnopus androsaceus JB14]|uniref:PNK3P-domain-containing protein n=1 Tax=Gymnopus androsaceus JB14 TaxID=1447944 RepID=A0A6A4I8U1_9AGAR|nr:PNK3P-domain-containing protein [Gymnopus androsaceus JB14]
MSSAQAGPLSSKKRVAEGSSEAETSTRKVAKVHPFFSKEPKESKSTTFQWHRPLGDNGTCLHGTNLTPVSSSKVAAFDLDGTLIKPSFGKGSVKPPEWAWWKDNKLIPNALKELNSQGYSIVIISNQNIKGSLTTWKEKIGRIAAALPSLPFRLLAATAKDGYRKPMPGMWNELSRIFKEDGVEIDKSASLFVGDAAGRDGDFASTDRKWALNVDIPFFTPEEYFLKQPTQSKFKLNGFNVADLPDLPLFSPSDTPLISESPQQEVVIFVGYPGLGKSAICQRYFTPVGYKRINQDTLGSRRKCLAAVEEALKEGVSCVIDNTNRDRQTRKYYVDLAEEVEHSYKMFSVHWILWSLLGIIIYIARIIFRKTVESREEKREIVPFLAYTSFRNDYEEPDSSEGFSEIKKVNWVWEGTEEEKRHWSMWLQIEGK